MNEPMVYPTVWAYEKACAALHESKAEVERLRVNAVAREGVLKREGDLLRGAQAVRDKLLARLQGEDFDISDMHDDNARLQVEVATLINRLKAAYAAAGISWSTHKSLSGVITELRGDLDEVRDQRDALRKNATAREGVMMREGNLLRKAQRERDELRVDAKLYNNHEYTLALTAADMAEARAELAEAEATKQGRRNLKLEADLEADKKVAFYAGARAFMAIHSKVGREKQEESLPRAYEHWSS